MTDKELRQAEFFSNRILKNEKRLRRWARNEVIEALRLYDRDIPEVPLVLDRYGVGADTRLHLCLYQRPYEKDETEEAAWLELMAQSAAEALGVEFASVFVKTRKRMRGADQYERQGTSGREMIVKEAGVSLIVNLSDYLDTGLFLDHRPTRAMVRAQSKGKRLLNLFAYTGSFSAHGASGGAVSVTSVDLSNTYLSWAKRNLELNGHSPRIHPLVRADVPAFLSESARRGQTWDLIVADPPTFSNSKAAERDFDVNRDWPALLRLCLAALSPGGLIFFSTNSRSLAWDGSRVDAPWEDITESTIPPDFRDRKAHRAWRIGPR